MAAVVVVLELRREVIVVVVAGIELRRGIIVVVVVDVVLELRRGIPVVVVVVPRGLFITSRAALRCCTTALYIQQLALSPPQLPPVAAVCAALSSGTVDRRLRPTESILTSG